MSEAASEAASENTDATTSSGRPRWSKILVVTAVVVAAALLGASGGLLLASPAEEEPDPSPVDVGFAQDMSAHHRQGVKMARMALQRSNDPEIRQLAFDIATTQNAQRGRMQGWLALWSAPARPTGERMSWMPGSGDHAGMHSQDDGRMMPGMATSAELQRLSSLSPPKLGTYFLQLMIRHHQGGAPMMRVASEQAEIPAVRNLAQKMLISQTREVQSMKRMLEERGGTPLPSPG